MEQPRLTPEILARGSGIYRINCAHCHGPQGEGNGAMAGQLSGSPTNLRTISREHTAMDIYRIVTSGKDSMPSFRGELAASDRWAVAYYVKESFPAVPSEAGRAARPEPR